MMPSNPSRYMTDPEFRERVKVRTRAHKASLHERGLCTRCGKAPAGLHANGTPKMLCPGSCTASPGKPLATASLEIKSTICRLLCAASLPPRRITALPLLTQIAAASAVTLGLLS